MGVLIKPLVTEKVSALNEHGKYGFVVSKDANKVQIKNEVEKTYGVTVESVNTMVQPGKTKRRYTKSRIIESIAIVLRQFCNKQSHTVPLGNTSIQNEQINLDVTSLGELVSETLRLVLEEKFRADSAMRPSLET